MLLTGLLLVAGIADTPAPANKGPVPPAALEQIRSQRSKDNPLSQTALQPIQPTACADQRPGCRHIDFFDIRANKAVYRVEINADLDYLNNGSLMLFPGESVVLRLEAAGALAKPVLVSGGLANQADRASGSFTSSPAMVAAMNANSSRAAAIATPVGQGPTPAPDQVRFTFLQADGQEDSVLKVENGNGLMLGYRAQMRLMNGQVAPTDVCQVMAGKFGFEHWPHPINLIVLGQMQLLPAANAVACQ